MELVVLDYFATNKDSPLHRLPALSKLLFCLALIAVVILSKSGWFLFTVLLFLYGLVGLTRLPFKTILTISLYPLLFALIFAYANSAAGWNAFFVIILRVVCTATAMVLLFATTPYPQIFEYLGKVMPSFLSTLLFLTYRVIFLLSAIFEDIQKGFYLRNGWQLRRPGRSLLNLAKAFGYLIFRGFDTNEKVYAALVVRGFQGKLYHQHFAGGKK